MKITEIKQDKLYSSSKYLKFSFKKQNNTEQKTILNFPKHTQSHFFIKFNLTGVSLPVYVCYQISKN